MTRRHTASNPRPKGSFVKQAAILGAASLLVRFIGFLYRLPLTGMIGDEGNGIYATSFYIYTFFLIMSSAGLPTAISKMVAERMALGHTKSAHRVFKIALFWAAILGLVASAILYFGAGWLCEITKSPRSYMSIVVLSPTVSIVAIMAVFRGYFQGMNNSVPTAVSQIIEQVFNAAFSVVCAYFLIKGTPEGGDAIARGAAGGTAGTGLGAFFGLCLMLWVYYLARPIIKLETRADRTGKHETDKEITRILFKTTFPIILGAAIFSVSNLIDMVMVKNCLHNAGVFSEVEIERLYGILTGKYVVITTLPVSISTALAVAVVPVVAGAFIKKEYADVREKVNTALRLTMLLSIPAAIGIGVLANPILMMLFPSFSDGGILLTVGAASIIFLSIAQITTGLLQSVGRVSVPVIGAFCGALIKIPLNFLLVSNPNINIVGAVISTTACYIVAAGIDWYVLARFLRSKPDYIHILAKPLLASVFMGACAYVVYNLCYYISERNAISTLIAIATGCVTYAFFMILTKGIHRNDLKYIPGGHKLSKFFN